jgi:hypothetical protein
MYTTKEILCALSAPEASRMPTDERLWTPLRKKRLFVALHTIVAALLISFGRFFVLKDYTVDDAASLFINLIIFTIVLDYAVGRRGEDNGW